MQLRVKPSVWITTSGLSPPWTLSTARIRISSSVLWSRARASRRFMPHYTLCLLTYELFNMFWEGASSQEGIESRRKRLDSRILRQLRHPNWPVTQVGFDEAVAY